MGSSTAYPSARALSWIRLSRGMMVTSWGGSPSSSAILGNVQPDLFEIELGQRRETVAIHRDAVRFRAFNSARRFLPRAFTRAASLGVDLWSYSVYSPRSI